MSELGDKERRFVEDRGESLDVTAWLENVKFQLAEKDARLAQVETILRAILVQEPLMDNKQCVYCRRDSTSIFAHNAACPWVQAGALVAQIRS